MKGIFKKVSCFCASILCAAALVLGTAGAVWADVDDTLKQQMITTAEGLTQTIVQLTDDQVEAYSKSSDSFTTSAMTAWASAKDELGTMKEDQKDAGETDFSEANGEYTITVPVAFEKSDAKFVYVFNESGAPTSVNVDIQYSMSDTLKRAAMNTVMGLATVFWSSVFPDVCDLAVPFYSQWQQEKSRSTGTGSFTGTSSSTCC